jgi:hypothetical protein
MLFIGVAGVSYVYFFNELKNDLYILTTGLTCRRRSLFVVVGL